MRKLCDEIHKTFKTYKHIEIFGKKKKKLLLEKSWILVHFIFSTQYKTFCSYNNIFLIVIDTFQLEYKRRSELCRILFKIV